MARIIVRRAVFSLLVLLLVSIVLFVLSYTVPVQPAQIVLGIEAKPDQIAQFNRDHGLDRPLRVQYIDWLRKIVLHGDFGQSFVTGLSVSAELARTFPISLEIVTLAFAFAMVVSLLLGILSAVYEGRLIDHIARVFSVVGVSIPGFWLGLMLIVYTAVNLGWFPPGSFVPLSRGVLPHFQSLVLPGFSLGIYYTAILSRMTRSSLVEVLEQDYIRTARSMGLSRKLVLVYALRNALPPVISIGAMSFGFMFGWALIIERVFNIGGLSQALLTGIFARDYLMVQSIVLVITAVFVVANLLADILNRFLNPRIGGTER
jgi:peptide/nickel transport system permease protein